MTTDEHTIASGKLRVSGGHSIWWQDWGNAQAKHAIFFLHGGPGSGCKDKHKLSFKPATQRVVFHDQRGSGQSTPFGGIAHNTTQDLIADIEALRQHLKLDSIYITGGSWGSTLALAYAIQYPLVVKKMLLGGIFLGTKAEVDYIQQGGLRTHFPDSWQQYIAAVPDEYKDDTVSFYLQKFLSNDADKMQYVKKWCLLEGSAMSIDTDFEKDELALRDVDETSLTLATLEAHYFVNNCFLPNNYLLSQAKTIAHIPTILMQGRFDHVCPPHTAYALANALGKNCHLHIMPGSHATELVTREVLRAYAYSFLTD